MIKKTEDLFSELNIPFIHAIDCARIQMTLSYNGYSATLDECYYLWERHSGTKWVELPSGNYAIWNILKDMMKS